LTEYDLASSCGFLQIHLQATSLIYENSGNKFKIEHELSVITSKIFVVAFFFQFSR